LGSGVAMKSLMVRDAVLRTAPHHEEEKEILILRSACSARLEG
jgi:hypothetical protein